MYRHLLFNALSREDGKFDVRTPACLSFRLPLCRISPVSAGKGNPPPPDHVQNSSHSRTTLLTAPQKSILRLTTLLLLFDVYLTWATLELLSPSPSLSPSPLTSAPLLLQYTYFLLLTLLSTLSFHAPIRLLLSTPRSSLPAFLRPALPSHPTNPNAVSTALLVSSCMRLFPILLIIWEYDLRRAREVVEWAVAVNNVAAVEILVGCGWARAVGVVGVGMVCRGCVVGWLLGVGGVDGGTGLGLGLGAWREAVGW